jgi:predicted nucleic acid-binding protein
MRNMFQGFFKYTEEEFNELWTNAIFVVDTNVLLNFYKYSTKSSYETFFNILKSLKEKERLYIPHQAALEYFHNYKDNMNKQAEGFNKLAEKLLKLETDAIKNFKAVESEHPYIENDNFKFVLEDLKNSSEKIKRQLEKEIESLPDVNEIESKLFELIDSIIGDSYNQQKINEIEKEGKERYKHEVPPGWEDKNDKRKESFRTFGGIRYQKLYGDLIMWNQMINKAEEATNPIIFITEEKKEDWWEKKNSAIIRPQPHLIQEFLEKTSQKFYMYRIDKFVELANQYLDANVTDEQIEKLTLQLENIRKVDEQEEVRYYNNYKKNADINSIERYLDKKDIESLDYMISSAYDLDLDSAAANKKYSDAIAWVYRRAIPNMVSQLEHLAVILSRHNTGLANDAFNAIKNLPNDPYKKVAILLDYIETVSDEIHFYESQGY